MNALLSDLEGLGYEIEEQPSGVIYRVDGVGVSTYVRDDDDEAMQSLIDSHDDRQQQLDRADAEDA